MQRNTKQWVVSAQTKAIKSQLIRVDKRTITDIIYHTQQKKNNQYIINENGLVFACYFVSDRRLHHFINIVKIKYT